MEANLFENFDLLISLIIGFLTMLMLVIIFNGAVFYKAMRSKREQVYQFLLSKSDDESVDEKLVKNSMARFGSLPFFGIFVFIMALTSGVDYLWLLVLILFILTAYLGYSLNPDHIESIHFKKRRRIGWNLFSWNVENLGTGYYRIISIIGLVVMFLAPLMFVLQANFENYVTNSNMQSETHEEYWERNSSRPRTPLDDQVTIAGRITVAECLDLRESYLSSEDPTSSDEYKEFNCKCCVINCPRPECTTDSKTKVEESAIVIEDEEQINKEEEIETIPNTVIEELSNSFLHESGYTVTPPPGWYLWEGVSAGINASKNFNLSLSIGNLGEFLLVHGRTTEEKMKLDRWNRGFSEGNDLVKEIEAWEKEDSTFLIYTKRSVSDEGLINRELDYLNSVGEDLEDGTISKGSLFILRFDDTEEYGWAVTMIVLNRSETNQQFFKEHMQLIDPERNPYQYQ